MAAQHVKFSSEVSEEDWKYLRVPHQLDDRTRALFEQYARVPPEEVLDHVCTMRDRAWAIHAYPCIGRFGFLERSLLDHPAYTHIVSLLKTDHTYLDLGCCFGQDIRKLVFAGAPSSKLAGADLEPRFWDLGYDLFRDRDTLESEFYQLDLFDVDSLKRVAAAASGSSAPGDAGFDIIHASSMFHLFDWDKQLEAMTNTLTYLLRRRPGSMVFGRQVGTDTPGPHESSTSTSGAVMYQHNEETQRRIWETVEAKTGLNLRIEVDLVDWQRPARSGIDVSRARMLRFAAMVE